MDTLTALLRQDDPFLRPVQLAGNSFPGIWTEMMPKGLFDLQFPEERRATCMNCPKACYEGFRTDYRCCTYHPRVSNFLLGIGSETRTGDAAIDRLIARGMLLPEGMYSTPGQWIDFLDDQQKDAFGSSEKVLCPMLNPTNGYCDIHAFRNAVCSTFFCHSDHGRTGEGFWVQIQTLGSQIELVLAQWSLRQVGFDLDRYFQAFDALSSQIHEVSTETGWRAAALASLWGDWAGREKTLMRECAAAIVSVRGDLWAIANREPIRESIAFDRAMDTIVPEHLEDEVEDEELSEDEPAILLPADTWEECLKAHERLWHLPEGAFVPSPNARILPNPKMTAEQQFYADKEYFIEYRFAPDAKIEWSLGITRGEKAFLDSFACGLPLSAALASSSLPRARTFLSEMLNKKVLWPQRKAGAD